MKKCIRAIILAACIGMIGVYGQLNVRAETIYDSPYVSFSPDKRAWTTDAEDRNVRWYREDGTDDVDTGIGSCLDSLREGQHYYDVWRVGNVPVSRWKVSLSAVNCCHMDYPENGEDYHGIRFERRVCLRPHYSAWVPYCADCGRVIQSVNFYMSREAADSIRYLEVGTGLAYYYLCPFSRNLEQGTDLGAHRCRAISKNRYCVEYLPNTEGEPYAGYMEPSFHFYDNAVIYEGREVTPQTHLNPNRFQRIGWRFCGWNTKADGTGIFLEDEAEILNLSSGQYDPDSDSGSVQLYAVWQKCSGELRLLLDDCVYQGEAGIYCISKTYGESYELKEEELELPDGSTVSFETGAAGDIPAIRGKQHLVEWIPVETLMGSLEGNTYWFYVPDGNVDAIRPVLARDPVILPEPAWEGKSFGGWFYDETFEKFAGAGGHAFYTESDVTLYARWVELHLDTVENYSVYGGSGAADLQWTQPDQREKVYQVYQSIDGTNWNRIYTETEIGRAEAVDCTYVGDGTEHVYVVPYGGLYKVQIYGAQGGNYGAYTGGFGGSAEGTYWLEKGERLLVRAGLQYGDSSGGRGTLYAGGGGYSFLETDQKGLLLLAGGGGGAGESGDGLPGGSSQNLVAGSRTGETGGSGGGGGYQGGRSGELLVHHHVAGVCNHVHTGNPARYGGCYTIPVICGRELEHEYEWSKTWYWGGSDEEYCPNCGADASKGETCTGHDTDYYSHTCPIHGEIEENAEAYDPHICPVIAYYRAGCGRTEDYTCGYTENQIISARPAYGGSSYVNSTAARSISSIPGVRAGDGLIRLQSLDTGFHSGASLNAVRAADLGKPEKIRLSDVERSMEKTDVICVRWSMPVDTGTKYYHQVRSYATDTLDNIGISNVTENTLISGIAGYFCCVDQVPERDYQEGVFVFSEQTEKKIILTEQEQYLHIAAVDVAGNIGETAHISLGTKYRGPEDIRWKIITEPLSIEECENVYWNIPENVYYVKSDGRTPFVLRYASAMEGPASVKFQLDQNRIESLPEGEMPAGNIVNIPDGEIVEEQEFCAEQLTFDTEAVPRIHPGYFAIVHRTQMGRHVDMTQEYTLEKEAENLRILLFPRAGANADDKRYDSVYEEDIKNGLTIIGDGTAPIVRGLEPLEELRLIDRRNGEVLLKLTAEDAGSGVKEFFVVVENKDNGVRRTFYPDGGGEIRIELTEDIPIFSGDFSVTVTAVDNVGNETREEFTTLEFDLCSKIERILDPHAPVFQNGESGVLNITTWGYAERIEVEFPEEIAALDETLNTVFEYEPRPDYKQEETLEFQIPLYTPAGVDYQVTVRAYKGENMLEQHPAFSVMEVSGTVLDELRTRLR